MSDEIRYFGKYTNRLCRLYTALLWFPMMTYLFEWFNQRIGLVCDFDPSISTPEDSRLTGERGVVFWFWYVRVEIHVGLA